MVLSCISLSKKRPLHVIFFALQTGESGGEQQDVPQRAPETADARPKDAQVAEKKGQIDGLIQQIDDPNGPYAALGERARQDLAGRLKTESVDLRAATDGEREAALQEADRVLQEISTELQADLLQVVDRAKKRRGDTPKERDVDPVLKTERDRHVGEMRQMAGRGAWNGVEDHYNDLLKLARKGLPMTPDDHYLGYQAAKARGDAKAAEQRLALAVDPAKLPDTKADTKTEEQKSPEPPRDDVPLTPKDADAESAPRGPTAKISQPRDPWKAPKNNPQTVDTLDPKLKADYDQAAEAMQKYAQRNVWKGVEDQWKILNTLAQKGVPLTANDYLLGSQSAMQKGDLVEARHRARDGVVRHPESQDLIQERDGYENDFGLVEVRYQGDGTLTPVEMPFDPRGRSAITAAQDQLTSGGRFTGLLPIGEYTVGATSFTVSEGQIAVKDARKERTTGRV